MLDLDFKGVKMLGMAKKTPKRGRPKGSEPRLPIQVRVPKKLFDALETLCERTRRTKNIELVLALEAWLAKENLWPPPPTP